MRFGINEVGVARVDAADEAVAAANGDPVFIDWSNAAEPGRWPAPRAVVLQPADDVIRLLGTNGDVIKLTDGHRIQMVPRRRSIIARVKPPVAADQHVPAVARIDPQGMLIGMDAAAGVRLKRLTAIG